MQEAMTKSFITFTTLRNKIEKSSQMCLTHKISFKKSFSTLKKLFTTRSLVFSHSMPCFDFTLFHWKVTCWKNFCGGWNEMKCSLLLHKKLILICGKLNEQNLKVFSQKIKFLFTEILQIKLNKREILKIKNIKSQRILYQDHKEKHVKWLPRIDFCATIFCWNKEVYQHHLKKCSTLHERRDCAFKVKGRNDMYWGYDIHFHKYDDDRHDVYGRKYWLHDDKEYLKHHMN
jgi:hypothetical protein